MKVLVIGAAGFIGRHCINHLQKKQYEVFGADIIPLDITPVSFLLNKTNTDFSKLFSENIFDVCINASGAASVPFSLEAPQMDFELNTGNVVKILEAVRVYNPSCFFINFSSAAVYGNPVSLPVSENMFSTPMSPYGWHKHFAEQVCKEYSLFFNIKICNLRIFSAYGPGLRKQFFWDLYNKFQKKGDIELYGTGRESRDFIYVDDITKCVELIIENRYTVTDNLNIATGIETTTSEAANIFAELLNIDKQITFRGEIRLGDPLNWRADINKIKSMGFNPSFTLKEGLKQYIEWLQKEKK